MLSLLAFAMIIVFMTMIMTMIMTKKMTPLTALILVPTAFGLLAGFGVTLG